jgi:hypothetical protein
LRRGRIGLFPRTSGSGGAAALNNLTDDLQFSNDSGATWNYVPTPDAGDYDTAITGLRVNPKGAFSSGGGQFTLRFRVMVK